MSRQTNAFNKLTNSIFSPLYYTNCFLQEKMSSVIPFEWWTWLLSKPLRGWWANQVTPFIILLDTSVDQQTGTHAHHCSTWQEHGLGWPNQVEFTRDGAVLHYSYIVYILSQRRTSTHKQDDVPMSKCMNHSYTSLFSPRLSPKGAKGN